MNPFAERIASLRALMRARDWDAVVLTGGRINGQSGNTNTIRVETV